jgi:hypothetical protein
MEALPDGLYSIAYRLYLQIFERSEKLRLAAVEKEFAERREEFAGPDEALEDDEELTPAEKTRVFKQGLYSRNKVGGIYYDQQHRTNEIKISRIGLKRIERIFEQQRHLTPAALLKVMDGCLSRVREQPTPTEFKRKVAWHARKGTSVAFFASYLSTIVKQLEMIEICPLHESGPTDSEEHDEIAA